MRELGLRALGDSELNAMGTPRRPERSEYSPTGAYAGRVGLCRLLQTAFHRIPGEPGGADRQAERQAERSSCSTSWSTTSSPGYERIAALGVDWVMPPTDQPWGSRAMIFADPEGNLINVFSDGRDGRGLLH